MKKSLKYLGAIAFCEAVGISGGLITSPSVNSWYKALKKPSINPSSVVFGPVWTILYALMGISSAIILQSKRGGKVVSLVFFTLQLILNFFWTVLFFGFRSPFWALVELIFLLVTIIITAALFFRISRGAGLLFIPYILWVCFASILNIKIWIINKSMISQ